MIVRCVWMLVWVAAACWLCGCKDAGSSSAKSAGSGTDTNRQVYKVKGVVHDVMPDKNKVRIAHEEVPGYMDAMTMSFDVKKPSELSGIKPGDSVSFDMVVTHDDGWIENVVKLSTNAPAPVAAAPENFRRVRDVEPLQVGDKMPEYHFTNEMGKAVSLSAYKGQPYAFTFIFTRCPFPTFCPRMSSHFRDTYKELQSMPNAPKEWHLFTITFDPQYDTPEVLKKYAEKEGADPKRWNFLTGDLIDITAIAEQFGLLFWRPEPKDPVGISHNLRTVVVDADGKVFKVLKENEWKPKELAEAIAEAAKR